MDNVINLFSRKRSQGEALKSSTSSIARDQKPLMESDVRSTQSRVSGTDGFAVTTATEQGAAPAAPQAAGRDTTSRAKPLTGDFSTLAARNAANADRVRREREQANKNVLKSYRIK